MMRFKTDENLPVEFAELLTQAGYEAVTVVSQGLQGKPDPVIVDACMREGRVLVTLDLGLADIRAYPPHQYPGFLVLRVRQQNKKHRVFGNSRGLSAGLPNSLGMRCEEPEQVRASSAPATAVPREPKHLIRVFQHILPMLKQEPVEGRLWIIEETRVRIRGEEA